MFKAIVSGTQQETSPLVKLSAIPHRQVGRYLAPEDTMGDTAGHEQHEDVAISPFSPRLLVNSWLSPAKPHLDRGDNFLFSNIGASVIRR